MDYNSVLRRRRAALVELKGPRARRIGSLLGPGAARRQTVIACISASKNGKLFNVNADTLAGNLAARLQAKRLIIAGATPGVLDKKNQTIAKLDKERIEKLVKSGTANAGMVAKLNACQVALKGGAKNVVIIDGRAPGRLVKALAGSKTSATTKVVN